MSESAEGQEKMVSAPGGERPFFNLSLYGVHEIGIANLVATQHLTWGKEKGWLRCVRFVAGGQTLVIGNPAGSAGDWINHRPESAMTTFAPLRCTSMAG